MRLPVIAEHVLHPAELLADVERPVLHPPYVHHVSHQQVAVDQPHLQDLGQLNGDDKGEGGDDLECNDELPERKEPGPRGFKVVLEEEVMKGGKGREEFNQRLQPVAQRKQRVNKIKTR